MNNHSKQSFSWMHPNLEVKNATCGKGVFTNKKINKNTIIVIFGGYVFTIAEEAAMKKNITDYAHQISPEFVIGVRNKSEIQPVDFINHSCSPNAGFKGQIFLVAMRNIEKDEEITFDYCMVLSDSKLYDASYGFECKCHSKECRKIVSLHDWKNPLLQKKYKGYFQWYLEEKINNL